jgi:hypothetical protein
MVKTIGFHSIIRDSIHHAGGFLLLINRLFCSSFLSLSFFLVSIAAMLLAAQDVLVSTAVVPSFGHLSSDSIHFSLLIFIHKSSDV